VLRNFTDSAFIKRNVNRRWRDAVIKEIQLAFKDSAEVTKYIGGIFEVAFGDPEIASQLKNSGLILEFKFTNPESYLVVDMGSGEISSDPTGGVEPSATLLMSADTGNAYWQGKVNLAAAMVLGKIKIQGNAASLLKLAPLERKLYPVYIETLNKDGREDLIV